MNNDSSVDTILDTLNKRAYRITMGREAFRAFLFTYFARSITYPMAEFQNEIIDILQDAKKNLVLTAFRGSGKSTLVTLAYAIWSIVGIHEKKFVVIVAQTEDRAQQCLKRVKDALLTSELLRNDFGAFEEPKDEWKASAINIPRFNARIAVLSVGQNIRGYINKSNRPDLMIFDDIEDTYTTKTKEARDKTFAWLTTEAFPAGDKHTRIIVVGNKVHEDASILRIRDLIAEGKWSGEYKEYPLLNENGAIVWPGKYPDENAVEREKQRIGNEFAFRREFLLQIVPEEGQVVFKEMLHYYDALSDISSSYFRFLAMGVDLAISEKKSADYTAIVCASVYGRGRSRKIYIHPYSLNKRMNFPDTIEEIKRVARMMQYDMLPRIFVESVGYQLSVVEQLRSEGYPAESFLPRGDDKRSRLVSITSFIGSGQILFPKNGVEELIAQLIGFGTERHDDLVDAFTLLIHKILEQDRATPPGNQPRIVSEDLLKQAYENEQEFAFIGRRILGVVTMGFARPCAAIVLRSDHAARVLLHEPLEDIEKLAQKIMGFAFEYSVDISSWDIVIDIAGEGQALAERINRLALNNGCDRRDGFGEHWEIPLEAGNFVDRRSRCYFDIQSWLKTAKLLGYDDFDDFNDIGYTEEKGRKMATRKELLAEQGVDISITDALALTFMYREKPNYTPDKGRDPRDNYYVLG